MTAHNQFCAYIEISQRVQQSGTRLHFPARNVNKKTSVETLHAREITYDDRERELLRDRLKSSTSPAKGNSLQRGRGGQKARSYFFNTPGDVDLKNKCRPIYQFLASHSWLEKMLHTWFSWTTQNDHIIVFTLSVIIKFQRTVGFLLEGGGGVYRKMIMNFLLLSTLNFWDGPLGSECDVIQRVSL